MSALMAAEKVLSRVVVPPAAVDAILKQKGDGLERLVKDQERAVLRYRSDLLVHISETNDAFAPLFASADRGNFIRMRMMVGQNLDQVRRLHSEKSPRLLAAKSVLQAEGDLGQNAVERRRFRKLNERMIASIDQTLVIARRMEDHLVQDLLKRIDGWLLENPSPVRSANDALPELLARYPVVAEYLAR